MSNVDFGNMRGVVTGINNIRSNGGNTLMAKVCTWCKAISETTNSRIEQTKRAQYSNLQKLLF